MPTQRYDIVIREDGSRTVVRNMNEMSSTTNQANSSISTLKKSLLGLAAGFTLAKSIQTIADFSREVAVMKAIVGGTEEEFSALKEEVKELGLTTRFSAAEAANAATEIGKAGFSAVETTTLLSKTLTLAQAAGLDLGSAAEITTSTLKEFGLSAKDTAEVVDVLAAAANTSNADVVGLAEGMKFVAPAAKALGLSLQQTTAALAILADHQLKGTLGGTGLKNVLAQLEAPSSRARKIFKDLGVDTEQLRISQVGSTAAFKTLRDAGIDAGQALRAFGLDGAPAFQILSDAVPEVLKMEDALNNMAGIADKTADDMQDNLADAMGKVGSALNGLVIGFGELGLEPFLKDGFLKLAKSVRFLSDNLDVLLKSFLEFSPVILFFFREQLITALATATASMYSFGLAMTATLAANPIALAAAGIGALILGYNALTKVQENAAEESKKANEIIVESTYKAGSEVQKILDNTKAAMEKIKKQDAQDEAFQKFLSTVEESVRISKLSTEQQKIENQLSEDSKSLKRDLNEAEKSQLQTLYRQIQGNEKYREVLEKVKAPQREFKETQTILKDLFKAGAITAEEYNRQIKSMGFAAILETQKKELELLKLSNIERNERNQILQAEQNLGRSLSKNEVELLKRNIANIEILKSQNEQTEIAKRKSEALVKTKKDLSEAFAEGRINADQYTKALIEGETQALNAALDFESGFDRVLLQMKSQSLDKAGQVEKVFTNAFNGATEALISFAQTGKANFKDFAQSIIADIARIQINKLFLQAFSAFTPATLGADTAGADVLSGSINPGFPGAVPAFANGGAFTVGGSGGTDSQLVAFRASPGEHVKVSTPEQRKSEGNSSIKVINVVDPNLLHDYINSSEGERVIINTLRRNKGTVKELSR